MAKHTFRVKFAGPRAHGAGGSGAEHLHQIIILSECPKNTSVRAGNRRIDAKAGMDMHAGVGPALLLSTLAGMSTALGSLIALFSRRANARFLSFSLGFSAGVMVLVSFAELLPDAHSRLVQAFGPSAGGWAAAASVLLGAAVSALIERAVPAAVPAGQSAAAEGHAGAGGDGALWRTGVVTALAITLHNFPEGVATFMAGYSDLRLGLPVAFSIALHNIPEGVAVAVPVYYGTGSRAKAFGYSAGSGLSEPLGALLAYLVLAPLMSGATLGVIFGAVAGVMIYISFDELIPSGEEYGFAGFAFAGIAAGAVCMWAALRLFGQG